MLVAVGTLFEHESPPPMRLASTPVPVPLVPLTSRLPPKTLPPTSRPLRLLDSVTLLKVLPAHP